MKYLITLMADGDELPWEKATDQERAEVMTRFEDFSRTCRERDGVQILAGEALAGPSDCTTVRWSGGTRSLTDGPFAEAVEGMGGFYLLEAPDLDTLLEVLTVLPHYDMQVSPVVDPV